MKVKELLDILSDADPNDNVAFYYLEKDVLNRGEFESFFDCMYEDIHGVRDFEFTIQNYMEVQEEKFMEAENIPTEKISKKTKKDLYFSSRLSMDSSETAKRLRIISDEKNTSE